MKRERIPVAYFHMSKEKSTNSYISCAMVHDIAAALPLCYEPV
jgi:hypothetical protein